MNNISEYLKTINIVNSYDLQFSNHIQESGIINGKEWIPTAPILQENIQHIHLFSNDKTPQI